MGLWLNRQSLPAYAAIGAGVLLGAFIVFFAITHGAWYDCMLPQERVTFWTEFGVSFGTIALALVTWASVYETQQVLRGEDRRFRQSRMPMVRMHAGFPGKVNTGDMAYWVPFAKSVKFMVVNTGDGPALDVRARFKLRVQYGRITRTQTGSVSVDDSEPLVVITSEDIHVTSFLESKATMGARAEVVPPEGSDAILQAIFLDLTIVYEDAFGSSYATTYSDHFRRPLDFTLTTPTR